METLFWLPNGYAFLDEKFFVFLIFWRRFYAAPFNPIELNLPPKIATLKLPPKNCHFEIGFAFHEIAP